jgi:hypothetical protein
MGTQNYNNKIKYKIKLYKIIKINKNYPKNPNKSNGMLYLIKKALKQKEIIMKNFIAMTILTMKTMTMIMMMDL